MTPAAGVDVGGTKIDACIVDPQTGEVQARERIPTLPERGGREMLDDCVALVRRLAGGRSLSSIGIGVCEFVDHLHEHFVDPCRIRRGRYLAPELPGYSTEMKAASLAEYEYPTGPAWRPLPS